MTGSLQGTGAIETNSQDKSRQEAGGSGYGRVGPSWGLNQGWSFLLPLLTPRRSGFEDWGMGRP